MKIKLKFGRKYSLHVKDQGHSYFFVVEVVVSAKINPKTGMTVDLINLDKNVHKILKVRSKSKNAVAHLLVQIHRDLFFTLQKQKVILESLCFFEERGFGMKFQKNKVYCYRSDFAIDKNSSLYRVTSFFDAEERLQTTRLRNLKDNYEEVIYSSVVD